VLETPGPAYSIQLKADRSVISASPNDLSYITVTVVDHDGRPVPESGRLLEFTIKGNATITATANAAPDDMQSFQKPRHRDFRGRAMLIIRPTGKPGVVTISATAAGLQGKTFTVNIR
jgi:beta-galactosidase